MCDPVTITVMALSYAQNEEEIKAAEQAERDRAARDLQHQENVIESSTAAAVRAYSSQQSAEAQEQKSIGEEIAMIKGEEQVLKASARVEGAAANTLGGAAMSNLNQILTSKATDAILTKEDEGEGLAQVKRTQGEETADLQSSRMTAAMAIPEQKMSSSDKFMSRMMALGQGYMSGQMLAGAGTPATTPPVPAAGAGFSPLTVGSNAAGLPGSNLLQAANAGVTSANIPAITPWNYWDKFKYATGNTTLNIPYGY
jgi:hypothetical protein